VPTIVTLSVIHNDEPGSGPAIEATLARFQELQREHLSGHDHVDSVSVSQQHFDEDSCDE